MNRLVVIHLDSGSLIWLSGTVTSSIAPSLHVAIHELLELDGSMVVDLTAVIEIHESVVTVLAAASTRAGGRDRVIDLCLPKGRRQRVRDAKQLRRELSVAFPTAA